MVETSRFSKQAACIMFERAHYRVEGRPCGFRVGTRQSCLDDRRHLDGVKSIECVTAADTEGASLEREDLNQPGDGDVVPKGL